MKIKIDNQSFKRVKFFQAILTDNNNKEESIMIHLLSPEQTQQISGGNIAIDLDDTHFIIIPSTGIPKPCARALEYSFNGLMNKELTTADVISVSLIYGKCTLSDYQLFIKNIETTLENR